MKWKNRIFWLRILIMVLVIVGSYLAYAFIYRGRNEPPTKRKTTNQEAAYYTLRGQIQMLSRQTQVSLVILIQSVWAVVLILVRR